MPVSGASRCVAVLCPFPLFPSSLDKAPAFPCVVVVASRCQVFRDKLFAVKFPGQTVKVTVKDTTEKVLRNFLHFVYTYVWDTAKILGGPWRCANVVLVFLHRDSTDKDVDDETVFPLLDLANRFEFPLLAQSCSTHLRNALNADTVGMMLRQAEERGHKEFAHSCRQWVALNAGDVCMDRNVMMKLPLSGIIAVCNSICTGVPEVRVCWFNPLAGVPQPP